MGANTKDTKLERERVSQLKRIVFVLCLTLFLMPTAQAVGTSASCAVLVEAESGRVLYEQESHQPRLIASITKLMTALVALESGCGLQEPFQVPDQAVGVEGSSIYLKPGETVTLEELLYGMMLRSGNDAALAVAIRCGGSAEQFVAQMNAKAVQLGMKNTHFANPNGLNAENHYSSAYDMALLARACLKNETLARIVSTKTIAIGQRSFTNHNKLLWQYEGCVGLKTGYTEKAGRTLVSAAQRDGMTLIAVTLNDSDDWRDHKSLLDWGFSTFHLERVFDRTACAGRLPVSGGLVPVVCAVPAEDVSYPIQKGEDLTVRIQWHQENLTAPVPPGEELGALYLCCGGKEVAHVPLTAQQGVSDNRAPSLGLLQRILRLAEPG